MNYFTSTHAISLFPRLTFLDKTMVVCQEATRANWSSGVWIQKYRERGYKVVTADRPLPSSIEVATWNRVVGDRLTWVMPFKRTTARKF